MKKDLDYIIDKAILVLTKATIFLLPLFFLPWTKEFFEFNKQYLLWLLVPLIVCLSLIGQFSHGEIRFKRTPLDVPIIIFLLLALASSMVSLDKFSSLFGYYGGFSEAWLGLVSLVLFYFIITNFSQSRNFKLKNLVKLFLISAALAVVIGLAAIFGLVDILMNTGNGIFSSSSFNTSGGSLDSLAIFSSLTIIVSAGWLASGISSNFKRYESWLIRSILLLALISLLLINFWPGWYVLLGGNLLIIILSIIKSSIKYDRRLITIILPLLLSLIAILFIIFPKINLTKVILDQSLPHEINLDFPSGREILLKVLTNQPMLGSGPGTFVYDFSLYRPAAFNYSNLWQIRYDKNASYFMEILTTGGVLVMLSYLLIICLFVYLNIIFIRKYFKQLPDDNLLIVLLPSFFSILIVQLLYHNNTILWFLFWFFLALIMSGWRMVNPKIFPEFKFILPKDVIRSKVIILAIFLLIIGWFVLAGWEIKFWLADVYYAKAAGRENYLIKAAELSPYRYNYRVSLAKYYLSQAQSETLIAGRKKNYQLIHDYIDQSINQAVAAQAANPKSVVTQETLGMIYRDIRLLTQDSEPWAIKSFNQALELEPTNPVLTCELAKAYLNNGDVAEAGTYFNKALELKSDYYDAEFGLAKVYLQNKKDSLAIDLLNQLAAVVIDPEIYYEQGRYYFNHGEIDRAIEKFKQALRISPDYANADYSLALAYQNKGDQAQALKFFKKVLELNPEDEEVVKRVEELSK